MSGSHSSTLVQSPEESPILSAEPTDENAITSAPAPILRKGQLIGQRYEVMAAIGSGGMGMVYHVYDRRLDRNVALKFIRPEILEKPQMSERFRREIQLASTVTHRNVVRVYDLGESDGLTFLTMQYIEGEDLGVLLDRGGALPISRAIDIFRQVCEGLKAAHEQGVVHRDLKPRNIMIAPTGGVYLTDFGLAMTSDQPGLTTTGHMVGTPSYMSPEQVKGQTIGPQSDIFSLGVILYEMVAGKLPFSGENVYEVMAQRLHRAPDPVSDSNPNAPLFLQGVLNRCLAVELSDRYRSIEDILSDLNAATVGARQALEGRKRRRLSAALAAVLILATIPVGQWLYKMGATSRASKGPAAIDPALHQLLIVPFENRTQDPRLDWYGEGLARLIGDGLAQSRFIRVIIQSPSGSESHRRGAAVAAAQSKESSGRYDLTGDILPEPSGIALGSPSTRAADRLPHAESAA